MTNLKIEFYLRLILIISLVSLFSAYFIEYGLGHQPCNLCLIERIPYGLSMGARGPIIATLQAKLFAGRGRGAIYGMTRDCIVEDFSRHGKNCIAYIMDDNSSVNIDTMNDLRLAEIIIKARALHKEGKI